MKIQGKEYITVNERVTEFRTNDKYKGYRMVDDIIKDEGSLIMIKTFIYDAEDRLVATGTASEIKGDGFINKSSHLENCETSSWGRALGNLGIGIVEGVASAEEVQIAINKETNSQKASPQDTKGQACPSCSTAMSRREGQYGEFWGCPNYKTCGQKPINIKSNDNFYH